ncbi:MAG: ArsR/SmtB family transcription factor [Gemmatimonadaceae bacterium]
MVERVVPLDVVFTALGDPTRRAILGRLRKTPATVTEIAAPFAVSLNAISKHVKVLERAGLVTRRRVGRAHHLSLNAAPLGRAARWLTDYQAFWETSLDRMERLLSRKHS